MTLETRYSDVQTFRFAELYPIFYIIFYIYKMYIIYSIHIYITRFFLYFLQRYFYLSIISSRQTRVILNDSKIDEEVRQLAARQPRQSFDSLFFASFDIVRRISFRSKSDPSIQTALDNESPKSGKRKEGGRVMER